MVSRSRNKIHQTWGPPVSGALYTNPKTVPEANHNPAPTLTKSLSPSPPPPPIKSESPVLPTNFEALRSHIKSEEVEVRLWVSKNKQILYFQSIWHLATLNTTNEIVKFTFLTTED